MTDRRQDQKTADLIREALRMKRAFDEGAGLTLLRRQHVPDELAKAALAGQYERRQHYDGGR
ncbi:MAG TPA: hypothetical protein VF800_02435 [Telluria sp.]|jgi:hypothetical protein